VDVVFFEPKPMTMYHSPRVLIFPAKFYKDDVPLLWSEEIKPDF
jgi:hypothetical protein